MAIDAKRIVIDEDRAFDMWQAYKSHIHYSKPEDYSIQRAYKLIAEGRVVVQAVAAVAAAGLKPDGFPHLALCRADVKECRVAINSDGSAQMYARGKTWGNGPNRNMHSFLAGSFRDPKLGYRVGETILPPIPERHRPKRGLANYALLWEAEWTPTMPEDPMLLRRLHPKADLWLVVAAWDLSPIERAVLQGRLNG